MSRADDKPTVPRMQAVLPPEAAKPVQFSRDELDFVARLLEALSRGKPVQLRRSEVATALSFARRLHALGVPPLDPAALQEEGER